MDPSEIQDTTAFRLDCDLIRLEHCAFTLAIEMGRQSFLMQFSFYIDVLEHVGFTLQLPNYTGNREASLHCFQLIPPFQPTMGVDSNLQQVMHILPPKSRRCTGRIHKSPTKRVPEHWLTTL